MASPGTVTAYSLALPVGSKFPDLVVLMLAEAAIKQVDPLYARGILDMRGNAQRMIRLSGKDGSVLPCGWLVVGRDHNQDGMEAAVLRKCGSAAGGIDGFKEVGCSAGDLR